MIIDNFEEFYESLPDEVDIRIKMDKRVFKEMYSRTQEQENGIVDERHVLNDWVLGTIRYNQHGVKFFYEGESNSGIPSVRFLDRRGVDLKTYDPIGVKK